jgi:putative ABC transport system permease protein
MPADSVSATIGSTRRVRLRSLLSWIVQPWRSPAVATALVGALALPTLVLAAGAMFRSSAGDEIAARVVDRLDPGPAGLSIAAVGSLGPDALPALRTAVEERLDAIDALGPVTVTAIGDPIDLGRIDGADGGPRRVRLFAREGAADHIDLIAGSADGEGVVVPATFASRAGLAVGDRVVVGDAATPVVVAGVYRDLWDGEVDPWWDDVPGDAVPRFIRAFGGASFELVIVTESQLLRLSPPGRVRWDAALAAPPRTRGGLDALAGSYRRLERDLVRETTIAARYRAFATDPEAPPSTFTALGPAVVAADALIADLEQPVQTATVAGAVAGVVLSTLGAVFLVRRHRRVYRILAADGDGWLSFVGRGLAQYLLPAAAGAVLGVVAAWVVVRTLGPSGSTTIAVAPWRAIIGMSAGSCLLAALVTASLAVAPAESIATAPRRGGGGALLLVGASAAMWIQVGSRRGGEVDPLVVAFPLVGIFTGVVLAVLALRWGLRRLRGSGAGLPTPVFFAWRAITASDNGALLVTAAVGLAAGLTVLSTTFVASIDRATEAKAATMAGAASRVDTSTRLDPADLPDGSTVIRRTDTQVGARRVQVLAIDPATFAEVVEWPAAFGSTPETLVDALAGPATDAVPAVVVAGGAVGTSGEFGRQRVFPYRVVATVGSAPMAADDQDTLIVRADVLEEFARQRWEAGAEIVDPIDREIAAASGRAVPYESPLAAFGNTVLSRAPLQDLTALAAAEEWRAVETTSLTGELDAVEAQATRWAFDFVGLLGVIAAVVALAVMTFHLAERRAGREVAAVMTQQMGIARSTTMLSAAVEMGTMAGVAVAAGVVAATVTARRVFVAFEPDPSTPPTVGTALDPFAIIMVGGAVVVVVAALAAWAQRSASSAAKATVLRG